METKELIKKYWFLGLICLLLIVFVGAYGINAYKNREIKVSTLKNEGKDVIYKLNGSDYYYADDLYDDMYDSYANALTYYSYIHSVVDEMIETTDEMSTTASNWAAQILQSDTQENINSALLQSGFNGIEDLQKYCLFNLKYEDILNDFYYNRFDELYKDTYETEKPRNVSHILISVADVVTNTDENGNETYEFNPTEEENKKLEDVLAAIKADDKAFEEIANEYSDDTGSNTKGGQYGLQMMSTQNFVKPFADAAFSLKDGEISEPIQTQFGWHIIKVTIPNTDEMISQDIFASDTTKAIYEESKKIGYKINDEKIKEFIESIVEGE